MKSKPFAPPKGWEQQQTAKVSKIIDTMPGADRQEQLANLLVVAAVAAKVGKLGFLNAAKRAAIALETAQVAKHVHKSNTSANN